MKAVIVAAAALLAGATGAAWAETRPPELNTQAARSFSDFQNLGPHRAFAVSPEGGGFLWAGASGPDPGGAVASVLKSCAEKSGGKACTLHVVNNYTVTGQNWRETVPARAAGAPDIGRLRPEPYWSMRGPQLATGLIVWSHGYMSGKNSTESAPQVWTGRFLRAGYDLYRFDREWIADWASDATALADAVRKAKAMGYRRVVLAGQSAGAWVSLAALQRGAPADGAISIAAAHHGTVDKMRDITRARSEWQHVLDGIKRGPRVVVVNFADDTYDVGGRMNDARSIFGKTGVDAVAIDDPPGFKGHGAGADFGFARTFGPCLLAFIENGAKQKPCS